MIDIIVETNDTRCTAIEVKLADTIRDADVRRLLTRGHGHEPSNVAASSCGGIQSASHRRRSPLCVRHR